MANKDLKNKYFTATPEVLNKLKSEVSRYRGKEQDKGYKRAKSIIENPKISYDQMKRIKTYFDNYNGDKSDDEYKLNGGDTMKKWVDKTLSNSRDAIHYVKDSQMKAGKENAFKKTHEKDRDNADPTRVRQAKIHKGSKIRNIMNNDTIYESVKNKVSKRLREGLIIESLNDVSLDKTDFINFIANENNVEYDDIYNKFKDVKFIKLYRAEGKVEDREKLPIAIKDNSGRWFTPNFKEVSRYKNMSNDRKIYAIDVPLEFYNSMRKAFGTPAETSKGEVKLPLELAKLKKIIE